MCLRASTLHHALFVEAPAVGIKAFSLHGDISAALLQNNCSADPTVAFETTPSDLHYPFHWGSFETYTQPYVPVFALQFRASTSFRNSRW